MIKRVPFCLSALIIVFTSLTFSSLALAQQPQEQTQTIEQIEISGNRRIPRETILYYVQSKVGDRYNPEQIGRDFQAILALGFFDPLKSKIFTENGPRGGLVVTFQVVEYPVIRDLQYRGLKSATESDLLEQFKKQRVSITKDSQFDPVKANAARNVIREVLAEKGHPDATIDLEIVDISATAIGLIFNINEGPLVRIKTIEFTGTNKFSQRQLRGAMKLVKESGLITSFTSKDIYSKDKLEYDLEKLRFYLGTKGYLQAKVGEPEVERAGEVSGGIPLPIPLLHKKGPGIKITVPLEIGRAYKITKVTEKGVTIFQPGVVSAVSLLRAGDLGNSDKIRKGLENIKNLYGQQGYINATADIEPKWTEKTPEEGEVEIEVTVDEGRQFTLHRLEFIGNTNTRDVVLRREVLLTEGSVYNKRLWDLSLLRLNQLGLFDEIKDKDAQTRTNPRTQEVDIDLNVHEKGRQSIQLNGGVSGIGGSFFGLSYSTNNLLGYGEALTFELSAGNRQLYFLAGFTEPYFLGKPISLGFQVFVQKLQFIGQGFNFQANQQLLQAAVFGLSSINADTLFTQRTVGGTVTASAPLLYFLRNKWKKAQFAHIGLSYSLTGSSVEDPKINQDPDPSKHIDVTFSQPRVITSRVTPSFSYRTLNGTLDPTSGQEFFVGLGLAGGILGGDVNLFSPTFQYKYFRPMAKKTSEHPQVLGMRFLFAHVRSFGTPFNNRCNFTGAALSDTSCSFSFVGGVPIFERFFLGGETDIRGYNVRSISPVVPVDAFLATRNVQPIVIDASGNLVAAPAGTVHPSAIRSLTYETPGTVTATGACGETPGPNCNVVKVPQIPTPTGGDTQLLYNLEYRIPIVGPITLAAFADVGTVFNARKYKDQVTSTNFINRKCSSIDLSDCISPSGILLNPAGRVATQDEIQNAASASGGAAGFRTIFLQGDSRNFSLVRLSQQSIKPFSDIRSSLGAEVRVQVPFINVPFRLIFAYNPNAKTDPNDPTVFFIERRTVVRFSVGRTF